MKTGPASEGVGALGHAPEDTASCRARRKSPTCELRAGGTEHSGEGVVFGPPCFRLANGVPELWFIVMRWV